MRLLSRIAVASFSAATALAPMVRAEQAPKNGNGELATLPLEDLMQVPIVTPTKQPTTIIEAPAIVSVITREEILTWGYRSVAEALEHVPGFYAIDDFVTPNFGVRGLSGGQRAYNRVIKVLINGQPTTFRPDGTNLLGPELIPMEAIERIEVVRGPASALYGANAYLGVVNIITRKPKGDQLGSVGARGGYGPPTGAGGEFLLQTASGPCGFLGAAAQSYSRRSGYDLPSSSPRADLFANKTSVNDTARPFSAFTMLECNLGRVVTVDMQALYSRLDAYGEWLDYGTLTHDNRIVQDNFVGRTRVRLKHTESLSTVASIGAAMGGPRDSERLSVGSTTSHPRRYFNYRALDLLVESSLELTRWKFLTGLDFTRDLERPLTVFIETSDGSRTAPRGVQPVISFHNLGVYGQGLARPFDALPGFGVSANLRYDRHNVFGDVVNYHVGLAHRFGDALTVKLLTGSSYQAPNAFHLYAQPLYAGDAVGNPGLKPEKATTSELQLISKPHALVLVSTNFYLTRTDQRIELIPRGITDIQPQNTGKATATGAELETRWTPGNHRVTAIVQAQQTKEERDDPFLGTVSAPSSSYPRVIGELSWAWHSSVIGTVGLRGRYVSARRASKGNIEQNNAPYVLDPYVLFGATWSRELGTKARVAVVVHNVLGTRYAEPGYNGIDLPGRRREIMASFTWLL